MPIVTFHKNGSVFQEEVPQKTNLVVMAGIRKFPFPHLSYGCGMGKCGKCACHILSGAEHLPEPGWKEKKVLGHRLEHQVRLACQLWLTGDLELSQDDPASPAFAAVGARVPQSEPG